MVKQPALMVNQLTYKLFKGKLVGPLKEMYEESFQNGYLPPTLRTALITVILKPDKSPPKRHTGQFCSLIQMRRSLPKFWHQD